MNLFMDVIGLESCSGLLEGILSESSELALQSSIAKGIHTISNSLITMPLIGSVLMYLAGWSSP